MCHWPCTALYKVCLLLLTVNIHPIKPYIRLLIHSSFKEKKKCVSDKDDTIRKPALVELLHKANVCFHFCNMGLKLLCDNILCSSSTICTCCICVHKTSCTLAQSHKKHAKSHTYRADCLINFSQPARKTVKSATRVTDLVCQIDRKIDR